MSTYAQVQHVEGLWPRPFAVTEVEHVQDAIERAERMVARRVDIPARITAGLLTADDVADAVASMVARMLRNPEGVTYQTAGPFSQTIDRSVASGKLELTGEERAILGMISGRASNMTVVDEALARPVRHVVSTSGLIPEGTLP